MSVGSIATDKKPVVSVITVVFNAVNTIEATIQSVISQTYKNIEFIIIDGGSTDGTLDTIQKYRDKIAYFVSEPDNGIYDAMNKGIKKSTGDWIYFLGADDQLLSLDVLESVFNNSEEDLVRYSLIYGDVVFTDGERFISSLDSSIKRANTVHHQGAFYNRGLFKKFSYDNRYSIYADYELNLLIYLRGYPSLKIRKTISKCSDEGISGKHKYSFTCQLQQAIIRKKYFRVIEFIFYGLLSVRSYLKIKTLQLVKRLS